MTSAQKINNILVEYILILLKICIKLIKKNTIETAGYAKLYILEKQKRKN